MGVRIGEWLISLAPEARPHVAILELTTRCNLSCVHCFRNVMRDPREDMPIEVARVVVRELREAGVRRVVLTGWGEPLVHPEIAEILEMLKRTGFEVVLNTNGTLLHEYLREVIECCDEVVVSLEGIRREQHEMTRGAGVFDKVIEALAEILSEKEKRRSRKPLVGMQFVVTKHNVDQLPDIADFAVRHGIGAVYLSNYIPVTPDGMTLTCYACEKCAEHARGKLSELSKRLFDVWNVMVVKSSFTPRVDFTCPFVEKSALYVRFDGLVSPCMNYAHSWRFYIFSIERTIEAVTFGDLTRERLSTIWRKEEYVRMRMNAKFRQFPSCLNCELQDVCSYTLTNEADCLGNSPTCGHCPFAHGLATCPL